ncbi:NAD(P)H-hydrate dehydratase [Paratissierella segnis]|jgi:NAD(P)H-hydrate epimerase|uniref:Multifunctional fusion protein n=1 Tax=Paratissierella segnis TaxID=2763679 RepID=A0A926IJQ8_9FIRM|nr:NAD(P)H-hydrate dehydratase [Paratissierella segnis]MBC8586918.1 NAD(P)H-hydrate dehydratase [Paratissierella segnis]
MLRTGVDIVQIDRIKKIMETKRESFYSKIFTDNEIEYLKIKNHNGETAAGLFAAKEAISKVFGTGIGQIGWKDFEILHDSNGRPYVVLLCNEDIVSDLGLKSIEVSISHEREYAIGFAIGSGDYNYNIPDDIKHILKKRELDTHKGTYGRVGIIGGKKGMTGSIYLTSNAALRCGSGLVYSIVDRSIEDIMSIKLIEPIIKGVSDIDDYHEAIKELDGLCIGPGFGVDETRRNIVKEIIRTFKGPIVLDADGINLIADEPDVLLEGNGRIVITPHPGELARLLGKSIKEIQNNRIFYSKYTAEKYNVINILKGHKTIVADKNNIYVNDTGNPGMATAGSGDVLSGMLISFICQGIGLFDSCRLGVFSHGLAGDYAKDLKGEYGLVASDILQAIPKALNNIVR